MKSYAVIWQRIKDNPSKGVPVDILEPFVVRVIKAVKNEKYYDSNYRVECRYRKKTGLMFVTRIVHPTDTRYLRVTFLLREFDTTSVSDTYYLRKYPPDCDLVAQLGLELMRPVTFVSARTIN